MQGAQPPRERIELNAEQCLRWGADRRRARLEEPVDVPLGGASEPVEEPLDGPPWRSPMEEPLEEPPYPLRCPQRIAAPPARAAPARARARAARCAATQTFLLRRREFRFINVFKN